MCSIFGALVCNQYDEKYNAETNRILESIYRIAHLRGRDGRGYSHTTVHGRAIHVDTKNIDHAELTAPQVMFNSGRQVIIGNTRAEPTTEFVREKRSTDQQPYGNGDWQIVHNGTIANDHEMRGTFSLRGTGLEVDTKIDSAAIVEALEFHSMSQPDAFEAFATTIEGLKGSYAILATTERYDEIYIAANYRPIWYLTTPFGVFFASTREAFPRDYVPQMLTPYSMMYFNIENVTNRLTVHKRILKSQWTEGKSKALVVCSGGLDSVVAATYAQRTLGHDVELIHFSYGSRAEAPEMVAIRRVAEELGVPLHIKGLPNVWDVEDSNLLQSEGVIAGGEAGAEFAHEWVPARNLVMLAVATAYAEAKGFRWLVLGNNLEEAGAYPDNEPEFIDKFNDLLPFAVGDGKKVTVVMPVGNMMKHEIVKLGHDIGAPMHLTWSCYRRGVYHCGKCGPCFMRRTAFEINNLPEVISYEA